MTDQPTPCARHPHAPVIGSMCGGCTQYGTPLPAAELTATLVIGRSYSRCGHCGKDTLPQDTHHVDICGWTPEPGGGCGARYVAMRSDYGGTGEELRAIRPDLPIEDEQTNQPTPLCGSVRDVLPCVLAEDHTKPLHEDESGYQWPTAAAERENAELIEHARTVGMVEPEKAPAFVAAYRAHVERQAAAVGTQPVPQLADVEEQRQAAAEPTHEGPHPEYGHLEDARRDVATLRARVAELETAAAPSLAEQSTAAELAAHPDQQAGRRAILDSLNTLAHVAIWPHPGTDDMPENTDATTIEVSHGGLGRRATAYALRQVADRLTTLADAAGEPPLDEDSTAAADARNEHLDAGVPFTPAEIAQGQADADTLAAEHPDTVESLLDEIADDIPNRRAHAVAADYLARYTRLLVAEVRDRMSQRNTEMRAEGYRGRVAWVSGMREAAALLDVRADAIAEAGR